MNNVPCFIREEVSGKANEIKIILAIKRLKKSTANRQESISCESSDQKQLSVKCSRLRDFPTIFPKKMYGEYSNYKRNPSTFNKTSKSKDISSQAHTILSGKKLGSHPHSIQKIRKRYSLDPPGRRLKTEEGVGIRQANRGRVQNCNESIKQIRFERFKERLRKLKEKGSLMTKSAVKSSRERQSFHSQIKFQRYRAGQVGHNSSVLITAGYNMHIKPNKDQFTSFSTIKRRLKMGRMPRRQGSQIPEEEGELSGWESIQYGKQKHTFFEESVEPI